MSRPIRSVLWIALVIVLAVMFAKWPSSRFFVGYAASFACAMFFLRPFVASRTLPKFSLRAILLCLGLIGCYLAYSKQRQSWERVHSFPGHVSNVAMSPDGSLVAASVGTSIEIRETKTGRHLKTLEMPTAEAAPKAPKKNMLWFCEFAFSQDNSTLLTAGWREQAHLYDWKSGNSIRSWSVGSMSRISRVGHRFATHARGGTYFVYSATQTEPILEVELDQPKGRRYSQLSEAGNYLVLGNAQNTLEVWDVDAKERCFELPTSYVNPFMMLTSFSPDEKQLAVPISGGIAIWDIAKREQIGEWTPDGFDDVRTMEWSPDGRRLLATYMEMNGSTTPVPALATSANPYAIHHCFLLDNRGNEISEVVGNSASFTSSGDRIATVSGSCNILDGRTGEFLTSVPKSDPRESAIGDRPLLFSPDGNWLFTNGTHGSAAVFKRTRSERWYSNLKIPAYWGLVTFFVLLLREGVDHFIRSPNESEASERR